MSRVFLYFLSLMVIFSFSSCSLKNPNQHGDDRETLSKVVTEYILLAQSSNEDDIKKMYHKYEVPYYRYLYDYDEYREHFVAMPYGAKVVSLNIKRDKKNEFVYKVDVTLEKKEKKPYNVTLNWVRVDNKFYNIKRHKAFFPEIAR